MKKLRYSSRSSDASDLKRVKWMIRKLSKRRLYWIDQLHDKERIEYVSSKSFGESDEAWIILLTGLDGNLRTWTCFDQKLDGSIFPSSRFEMAKFYHLEDPRRSIIHTFLLDIVRRSEFKCALRIFQEFKTLAKSDRRELNGVVDFSIGFAKGPGIFGKAPPHNYHVVIVETKNSELTNTDFTQCLSEAAILYKSQKDAGIRACSVCGIVSNAFQWQFLLIDKKARIWKTELYAINLLPYDEAQVLFVYRFLHYVIKCCYESADASIARKL